MNIEQIQTYLTKHDLDGWLLADFHARNTVAVEFLSLSGLITRRSFYFIPTAGEPTALANAIEQDRFAHLPGRVIPYLGYRALERELRALLASKRRIAMEYSPQGRLPYVGLVDAGTIELIRRIGVEIVSSADLVANFQARLSPDQIASHRQAVRNVMQIKDEAFAFIRGSLANGTSVREYDVVQFILDRFEQRSMDTDAPPICAVGANASDPHYEPDAAHSAEIQNRQLILIDLWAKARSAGAVFADITWMAFAGKKDDVPDRLKHIFAVTAQARDTAVRFLEEKTQTGAVRGADVDDACRQVIEDAGYGQYFVHRTGHSITSSGHGPGPNIDNLETEDARELQSGHLFSIEPGIYLPDYGFRTEINVLMGEDGPEVTTLPLQMGITPLF